ncbi:hypothetical protein AN958_04275 [Leucoagaricus sp. SymC.cos]|nr:hypothetical protein AN958_04275 [Leucoagaricus sp. SymC.cos]
MAQEKRWAMVDDSDPSIHYSAGWVEEVGTQQIFSDYGIPYLSTLHRIPQKGSLSFGYHGECCQVVHLSISTSLNRVDFPCVTGSSIWAWGFDPGNATARASWNCSVDGLRIPSAPFSNIPRNNNLLCWDNGLLAGPNAMGPHTLTIDVAPTSSSSSFWIDWIQYTPQSGFVFDAPNNQRETSMLVDNTDPMIQFDNNWLPWLNGQAAITSKIQSEATINFNGTALSWYGVLQPEIFSGIGQGSYSVDGRSSVSFSWYLDPQASNKTFQHFFTTSDLPLGPHQAVVEYLGPTTSPLILDYLIIHNASLVQSTSSPSPSDSTTSSANPSSGIPFGAIVGGVIGGIAAILAVLMFLLWRRRRRGHRRSQSGVYPFPHPFPMTYAGMTTPRAHKSKNSQEIPLLVLSASNPEDPASRPSSSSHSHRGLLSTPNDSSSSNVAATQFDLDHHSEHTEDIDEPLPNYAEVVEI